MKAHEVIEGRYVLKAPLGRGGMAEVWRAHDERMGRPVAIKFLAPRLAEDAEFLVRFFREAQSVAQMSHPNVISVLDFGEAEGRPYIVMEYAPGGALIKLSGEALAPERAAELVADAARGAGEAHSRGIVHRDIKPGNILLFEDGTAKLADFGIASSQVQEGLTATGAAIGSPHYVSPEHAKGLPVTPASDVYSLGVVLYQLLTGRRPFEANNVTAIAIAHVEEMPETPSAHVSDLDPLLEAIVLRCLEKDPSARFSDGFRLAQALDHLERGPGAGILGEWGEDELPAAGRGVVAGILITILAVGLVALAWFLAGNEPRTPARPPSNGNASASEGLRR
ncbi:MAG: serine/threonine protein kinase [Actinomycetota bacterium]|nr:serine/threonine protein kinase [Actinomycetota bacterium]